MPRFRKVILTALASLVISLGSMSTVQADPLITPVGAANNASTVNNTQFNLVRFTFGSSFTNVQIAASLVSLSQGLSGTAFLMNQVGPGTTIANQLASTAFNFAVVPNFNTVSYVTLFSGLSLGPGTYYAVFAANTSGVGAISLGTGVTYATAPGVSVGIPQFSGGAGLNPAYPPASTWGDSGLGNRFFTVTGDGATAVPEPATMFLLGSGLGALGLKLRRKKRSD